MGQGKMEWQLKVVIIVRNIVLMKDLIKNVSCDLVLRYIKCLFRGSGVWVRGRFKMNIQNFVMKQFSSFFSFYLFYRCIKICDFSCVY